MPGARELLQRFRPVGTPGAASPAGVPADRLAELGRELQPVFDELAPAQLEAGRIRERAETEARARRDAAVAEAAALLESARRDAEVERAAATAAFLHRTEEESAAELARAERDAAAVTERAEGRYAGLVEQVVRGVGALAVRPVPGPLA